MNMKNYAVIETYLPFLRVEIFNDDVKFKIAEVIIEPCQLKDTLKKYHAEIR